MKRLQSTLEGIMNPSKNMKVYRDRLRSYADAPCVPFLPLHLKDLVFANEAGKTAKKNVVNFDKLSLVAKCIIPLATVPPYASLEEDHALQAYFRVSVVTSISDPAAVRAKSNSKTNNDSTLVAMKEVRAAMPVCVTPGLYG